jgi:hypothetical protein
MDYLAAEAAPAGALVISHYHLSTQQWPCLHSVIRPAMIRIFCAFRRCFVPRNPRRTHVQQAIPDSSRLVRFNPEACRGTIRQNTAWHVLLTLAFASHLSQSFGHPTSIGAIRLDSGKAAVFPASHQKSAGLITEIPGLLRTCV